MPVCPGNAFSFTSLGRKKDAQFERPGDFYLLVFAGPVYAGIGQHINALSAAVIGSKLTISIPPAYP